MNLTKIVFAVALIAFTCITFSHSLKCYSCDNKKSCKKPKKYECNQWHANNTRAYIAAFHTGVNLTATSPYYECFREELKVSSGEHYYKGCTYQNIAGCTLQLHDYLMTSKYERSCNQCSHKDGCNTAGHITIDMTTISATIIVAFIVCYLRY